MMRRNAIVLAIVLLAAGLLHPAASRAGSPYEGYIYNANGSSVHSINGYLYERSLSGFGQPEGAYRTPQDLFITQDDALYLADTGNNRILVLTPEGDVVRSIGDPEGKGKLNGPKGVFVTGDGLVYVADTGNKRIAVFDAQGRFQRELAEPSSPLLGPGFKYAPAKLVVDKRGYIYLQSEGLIDGLMQLDPGGAFKGFFGANHVPFSFKRLIVKLIATREQQEQMQSLRPAEFSNVFQDGEGFLYTTTLGVQSNQVKRLSASGVDTLNRGSNRYGDYFTGLLQYQVFVDVAVDGRGFITALDAMTGKFYEYDKLGNLLFISGGLGSQNGLFVSPSSVGYDSRGRIYVVDSGRNRIDRFYATPFAGLVHEASTLYAEGRYEEAAGPWKNVLEMNSNYEMAYTAIGTALYKAERYKEAMAYFKLGRNEGQYSEAFREYRKIMLREYFDLIVAGLLTAWLTAKLLPRLRRRRSARGRQEGERAL